MTWRNWASIARPNIWWGLRQGAFYACGFTMLGAIGWVLGGPDLRSRIELHATGILLVYLFAGVMGGVMIGICRPMLNRLPVALTLGSLIGTMFVFSISVWSVGLPSALNRGMLYASLSAGALLGVLCGWLAWNRQRG